MTALPNYPNVIAINARRAKITAGNSIYKPQSHGDEIAHALRGWDAERVIPATATQAGMVENARVEAPQWQSRDGNGRIIRKADALPEIKPQAEIDDESPPGIAAWLVMFAATVAVVAIMAAFDWLVGAV